MKSASVDQLQLDAAIAAEGVRWAKRERAWEEAARAEKMWPVWAKAAET